MREEKMIETKPLDKIINFSVTFAVGFIQAILYLFLLLGSISAMILVAHLYPDDIRPIYNLGSDVIKIMLKIIEFFLIVAFFTTLIAIVVSLVNKQEAMRLKRKEEFNIYLENKIKEMKNGRRNSNK